MAKHAFYLHGGGTLNNLFELAESVESMEEHVFSHHVTHDRNDFANWIEHSFENSSLASKIRECKTPEEVKNAVEEEISNTEKQKQDILRKPDKSMREEAGSAKGQEEPSGLHEFMLKEFVFGSLFGFILGILIMTILVYTGIIY